MATITFTFVPSDVPEGSICRLYHADNSEYIGESVSDGTGTVTVAVPEEWLHEIVVRIFPSDHTPEIDATPVRMVIE